MRPMFVVITAAAVLLLSACNDQPAETPPPPPRPIRAVTVHVQSQTDTVTQTGEIRPRVETPMSFRLDGQLTYRVENGVTVKAGEPLARLDKVPTQNNLLSARADLANAKAAQVLADVTARRYRDLNARDIAPKAKLDEAEANLEAARAKVEAAQAALANAEQALSYTEIKAPWDGAVTAVGANAGQVVAAGQMIVTLISNGQRDAVFDVPESLLAVGLQDTPVDVRLLSNPDIQARGTVREITPLADAATRTFRIKVTLGDNAAGMPFGAAVNGSITLAGRRVIALPASALTERGGKPCVLVFDPASGALSVRPVRVERFDERTVYVADGLEDGDIVATAGVSKLREGEIVTLEAGAAP